MRNKNIKIEPSDDTRKNFQIKKLKGFRRNANGKIEANKMIDGKRYWELFDHENDAYYWKKNFHPLLNPNPHRPLPELGYKPELLQLKGFLSNGNNLNGKEQRICFKDVWITYWNSHLLSKELHTQHNNKKAADTFFGPFLNLRMCDINRGVISSVLKDKKMEVLQNPLKSSQRYSFNNELKKLSTLFNWYKKNFDQSYENPVCSLHLGEGFIRKIPNKKRKLNAEQVIAFFNALEKGHHGAFWRDFAETQLYIAGRVQEVGGLLWRNVNFHRMEIEICEVAVYIGKYFTAMKDGTKTGETRIIKISAMLNEILLRRYNDKQAECPFVFHMNGKPMSRQLIEQHYNNAFMRAGLEQFRGTHTMRHTMANLVREHLSLDHAKAAGGWKSSRVVENIYTNTPTRLSSESVNCIETVLSEQRKELT
ncbi:MAG: hypothetical protein A2X86_19835 [Bdellovibrionales bacterium GWA2_49_15]|nr:MAG: hypothetical protein A2X86_19835 [Bdellovibrionales bacterium GWA2_49_15]HAZ12512.1 hypothetical protein [Bdellovibrionales bacterium]